MIPRTRKEYLETQVMTAAPHQLHLMVVDAAIQAAKRAEAALLQSDVEAAHFALSRSRDCVAELVSGLDAQQSPELAARLNGLFVFIYRNLVDADIEHDPQLVRDSLRILQTHRETWLMLIETLKRESAAVEPNRENGILKGPHSWTG